MVTKHPAPENSRSKSTLAMKMATLQQTINVGRNKDVSYSTKAGKMSYSYTTLEEWWGQIKDFFSTEGLRAQWCMDVFNEDTVILRFRVTNLEDGEHEESSIPIKFHHVDFRADGARYSYWCRMLAIRACGLITNDDEAAETWGMDSPSPSTRTKKSRNDDDDDSVVY